MQNGRNYLCTCALLCMCTLASCAEDLDDLLAGDESVHLDTSGDADGDPAEVTGESPGTQDENNKDADTVMGTESEWDAGEDTCGDSTIVSDTCPDSETEPEYDTCHDSETENEYDTCHDSETEPEYDTCHDSETEPEYDTCNDIDSDPCVDTCTCGDDTETESEEDTDYDTESETEVDTSIDTESETVDTDSETEIETDSDTETESVTEFYLLCIDTDGTWDPSSCGHYVCGEPPVCGGLPPTGGCDCGPDGTFDELLGCVSDAQCIDPCEFDINILDFSGCSPPIIPIGAGYDPDLQQCRMLFGCLEALPVGLELFSNLNECTLACAGCESNDDCHESEYCLFPPESECGALGDGTCVPRGEVCTLQYDPVCTCAYTIASNACWATILGLTVQFAGECDPEDVCTHNGGTWDGSAGECICPPGTLWNFLRGCEPQP